MSAPTDPAEPASAPVTPEAVLAAWFGAEAHRQTEAEVVAARMGRWFGGGPAFDAELRAAFGEAVAAALAGALDPWAETAPGRMALVILLDQVTRNIHRGTPLAFAGDERARAVVERAVAEGDFQTQRPIHRVFLALPWEHHEDLDSQRRAIEAMAAARAAVAGTPAEGAFAAFVDYAHKHEVVVARFGRFPHRNAILGRESTAEEVAFLQTPGSSF